MRLPLSSSHSTIQRSYEKCPETCCMSRRQLSMQIKLNMGSNAASFTFLAEDNGNNHAVNSQNTSHDDWDNRSHDKFRFQDTDSSNTNA